MALTIGDMQFRVTFWRRTEPVNRDTFGQADEHFAELATVWAAIDPISAGENQEANSSKARVRYMIRFRTGAVDLRPEDFARVDGWGETVLQCGPAKFIDQTETVVEAVETVT